MRIYGVVGWKNSGKTGLMERLVADITSRGFSVSTVKHAHHAFDIDQEGTDSYRHRQAGAGEVLLVSDRRWALMRELSNEPEPSLDHMLAKLGPADLILIEGFKDEHHAKIEAHRSETGKSLIAQDDPTIRAVASDVDLPNFDRPVFDLNKTAEITAFILEETGLA